jgi:hypothetical protein
MIGDQIATMAIDGLVGAKGLREKRARPPAKKIAP